MNQVGKIERINENKALISVKRTTACGDSCNNCGASCKVNNVIVEAYISGAEKVGDYVEIKTENEVMFKYILILYGTPLVLILCTIFIVYSLLSTPNKEIISAISGLASLIFAYYILKAYDKNVMKKGALKFTIVRKL